MNATRPLRPPSMAGVEKRHSVFIARAALMLRRSGVIERPYRAGIRYYGIAIPWRLERFHDLDDQPCGGRAGCARPGQGGAAAVLPEAAAPGVLRDAGLTTASSVHRRSLRRRMASANSSASTA